MQSKRVTDTIYGQDLSALSLGCWGLGGSNNASPAYANITAQQATKVIHTALEGGISLFDSAPAYANGQSEIRLGNAIALKNATPLIMTKAGWPNFKEPTNYSKKTIIEGLEQSIDRLGYVDILVLHLEGEITYRNRKDIAKTMDDLRRTHQVRAIGVSTKAPIDLRLWCDLVDWDIAVVNFNMLDIRAYEQGIFEMCQQYKIDLVVRTVFALGFLAKPISPQTIFQANDIRHYFSKEQTAAWITGAQKAMALASPDHAISWPLAAIRFCLSFKAIKSILIGPCTIQELQAALPAMDKVGLDPAIVEKILYHARSDTYFIKKN